MADEQRITIGRVRISCEENEGDRAQLKNHLIRLSKAGAEHLFYDIAARTADLAECPGLQEALEWIKQGKVARFLVPDVDRLTCNQSLLDLIKRACKKHGTELIPLSLGIDLNTPTGSLLSSVMAAGGEYELSQIRFRFRRNADFEKDMSIRRGGVRFGYFIRQGRVEIDTRPFLCILSTRQERSKADIARHQFDLFLELKSSSKTIAAIQEFYGIIQPVSAPRQKMARSMTAKELDSFKKHRQWLASVFRWTEKGLLDWIADPWHCGDRVKSKYEIAEDDSGKRYKKRLLRRDEWEIIPNDHPALIGRFEHESILQIIQGNHSVPKGSGKYSKANLFKGLVFCGQCGNLMHLQGGGNRTQERIFAYQCSLYIKERALLKKNPSAIVACNHQKMLRIEKVEEAVIEVLTQRSRYLLDRAKQGLSQPDEELEPLEVVELRNQILRYESMNDPDLDSIIQAKQAKLAQILGKILTERQQSNANDQLILNSFQDPEFWLSLSHEEKREFIGYLVRRIEGLEGCVTGVTLR